VADAEDSDNIYICHACIGDAYLKQEVLSDAHKRTCHFCRGISEAWPLDELAERIQMVIEEHFVVTPDNPSDDGFYYDEDWERRGEPVAEVIAEIARLEPEPTEAVRERLSEKTYREAFEGGEEDPYGSDTHYEEGQPDTCGFRESWEFFRKEIRTRTRFFGRYAQQALDEIFGDLASLKTWNGTPAIKEMRPTDEERFIYRARIAYSESEVCQLLRNR
jgi:hypothetical protein